MSKEQPSINHFFKPVGRHASQTKMANVSKDQPLISTDPISQPSCNRQETESSQNRIPETVRKRKSILINNSDTSEEDESSDISTNIRDQSSHLAMRRVFADSEVRQSVSPDIERETEGHPETSTVEAVVDSLGSTSQDKEPSVA